jgi:hypothetical protein
VLGEYVGIELKSSKEVVVERRECASFKDGEMKSS